MSQASLKILLYGASGRMGRQVLSLALKQTQTESIDIVTRSGPIEGYAGPIYQQLDAVPPGANVAIDFSLAEGFSAILDWCLERRIPLVSGTTGLSAAQQAAMCSAGEKIPILWSANMSLGISVLNRLVREVAASLDADAEIVEIHHQHKVDAPSGTALTLARAIAAARDLDPEQVIKLDRNCAEGPRGEQEIGMSSLRAADVVGEHSVLFAMPGERLELTHRATDRAVFARGALRAAQWLLEQGPGVYSIDDLFGA